MKSLLSALLPLVAAAQAGDLAAEALAGMKRATEFFTREVAYHGGYLWRYSEDLKQREGEGKATATQVWVQPPGTPAVGLAFVRAYQATGERQFLDAAVAAAHALVFGQMRSGGWEYSIDFSEAGSKRFAYRHLPEPKSKSIRTHSVLDDDTTQAALRHLMAVDQLVKDEKVHEALAYGLDALLKAQLPKGGWPQVFGQPEPEQQTAPYVKIELDGSRTTHQRPTRYWHYATFNDGAINDCIAVCLEAHERMKEAKCLDAARRAGDFIILSQLKAPQAGWAQQYTHDLKPEWARKFEPPAACSAVAVRNIRSLIEVWLATGDAKYLEPIPAALDWLERSRLAGDRPRWARFYELGTNRPLYFVKGTYELTYRDDNLPTHYSFVGEYGVESAARWFRAAKEKGRDAILAERSRKPTAEELRAKGKGMEGQVRSILAALDARGRWLTDGWIECRTFIRNLDALSTYLVAQQRPLP
ncbi:MAG: hypothetical protein FJ290_10940 [Planctomycetes bacterium]|nr:hypothetical protein [Planctomycetota bacterium]